jgi:N-methylhydantoinase A/oxoprolinase/acetone carboxylase beta subunit
MTRVGVDVGGTFTDVISRRGDGTTAVKKVLSTPPDYDRAIVSAVTDMVVADAAEVTEVVHGTTVATNAVLERRGALTALVTTAGFRDVLELRRLRIPHMYDPFWRKPPTLVERRLRFELNERVAVDGRVISALDESEVRSLAARLRAEKAESVAVCLIHSYLHPAAEERVGAILREELPETVISLSTEILREQREYERTATTVVNAYVRPLMTSYLDRIRTGLERIGVTAPLMMMQSSGGVMTAEDARIRPVFALESGPAAGVVAALGMATRLGFADVIAFDMGGTTAKASLIEQGALSRAREYEAGGSLSVGSRLIRGSGELLRIPSIDIAEVGAGGGSIAWLDAGGGLQVGPRSAGADPGPACYDRGGAEPTVTDANVVLGYMPAATVADGQITISLALAESAVEKVAEPLGLSLHDTAAGIHDIANARMTRALRAVSSERGRDPRDFTLVAYGGSGPVHAVGLADELGITTVVVPPLAGLFSSIGLLFARPELHSVRTCHLDPKTADATAVSAIYDELETELRESASCDIEEWIRSGELRYQGQTWEVEVDLAPGPITGAALHDLAQRFEDEHERLYGVRGEENSPIELRALRLAALGPSPAPDSIRVAGHRVGEDSRLVRFRSGEMDVPVVSRSSIDAAGVAGPLLIDEYDTTVVVPPEWSVRSHAETASLILERVDDE